MSGAEYASMREVKSGGQQNKMGDGESRHGFFEKIEDFVEDIGSAFKFGKPDADVQAVHIPHLSTSDAKLVVEVLITNPNPVPIPLCDIEYLIETNKLKLVSGVITNAGTIHAHGSELITIPVNINFKDITETFEDLNPGQIVRYRLHVTLIIDVPVFGRFSIPLDKEGQFPIPQKPDVDLERVRFQHLDWRETQAILHLKVQNANPFDLDLKKLSMDIKFGNVSVGQATYDEGKAVIARGSDGASPAGVVIARGADGAGPTGVGRLQVPITFRPQDFGSALWDMIRGRGTGYSLNGNAEVHTPFGPIQLPFVKEGGKTTFKNKDNDDGDD